MWTHIKYWTLVLYLLCEGLEFCQAFLFPLHKNTTTPTPASSSSTTTNTTTTVSTSTTATNYTLGGRQTRNEIRDPVKAEAGTIAGVVFGLILCLVIVSTVGIMYLRKKRHRDEEYRLQTHVLKTSSQSAGVYMDTTTDTKYTPAAQGAASNRKYTSLKKNPNLYEDDSEDELWSSEVH